MDREVLLFNRQINNKPSKKHFLLSLSILFLPLTGGAAGLLTRRKIRYQSRIKELRFSCAQPFYFFSIRIYASVVLYCVSPTGGCILKFSLTISLSVHCKLFALI